MPHVQTSRLKMYYESNGDGHPLVLIRGLASTTESSGGLAEKLSQQFRVISFDNRCAGRTDQPQQAFTTADMADDTAALMDALGLVSAHVLGISLGGMVAQELALGHPRRVRRLALACTHAGIRNCVRSPAWATKIFNESAELPRPEAVRHSVPILFAKKTVEQRPELIDSVLATMINNNQPRSSYLLQVGAAYKHDAYDRLAEVRHPTLVLTGAEDVLIPGENSRLLAGRIRGARLVEFEEAGHLFFMEELEGVSRALVDFFRGNDR